MNGEWNILAKTAFVNITTYRQNGSPVKTPVWVGFGDQAAWVWTNRDTWKVKRLAANPACQLRPCNVTGRREFGPVLTGNGTVLADRDRELGRRWFLKKYPVQFRIYECLGKLRGSDTVFIKIDPEENVADQRH